MKKELAKLAGLAGQLGKLRGAIEDARGGRELRARGPAARTQRVHPPRGVQPEHVRESRAQSFVEFSGAQLMDAPAAGGTVIELVEATGLRLTIRLAAGQSLDVAALVALFREAQR